MADPLEHPLLSAHDPDTGRLDALRLSIALAVAVPQMARIIGTTPSGLREDPAYERLQGKLAEIVDLTRRLRVLFDGNLDHARVWLGAPHPYLEGKTPLACLEAGRFGAVETLVCLAETGQPG